MFSFGFKKKPPKKVSIKKKFFLQETSFYKLVYINSVSSNYKNRVVKRRNFKN